MVSLNSSLTLNCLAVGYPLPVVTWWFNGTLISIQSSQFETGKDNSLRIESVRSSNLGVYTCQTYNGVGKSASWSVTVEARETNQDTSPKGLVKPLQILVLLNFDHDLVSSRNRRPTRLPGQPVLCQLSSHRKGEFLYAQILREILL